MSLDFNNADVQKALHRWCGGNEDAMRLLMQFGQLAREVDDLIDEDNDDPRRITTILELSLVHIAGNPFYQRFYGACSAVVFEMLAYWRLGDEYRESKDAKKQQFGFVYRESTDRLAVVVAGILGGTEHAIRVSEELYQMTHAQSDETLEDWVKGEKSHGDVQRAEGT